MLQLSVKQRITCQSFATFEATPLGTPVPPARPPFRCLSPPHALDSGVFGKVAGIMTAGRRDRLMGAGDLESLFDGRNRGSVFRSAEKVNIRLINHSSVLHRFS
jgi:hypothetical protein